MKQTKLVQKSEKKMNVLLGGYLNRQKNLVSRIQQLHRDIDMTRINYLCFSKLAAREQKSCFWSFVFMCRFGVAFEDGEGKTESREGKTQCSAKEI